MQNNKGKSKVLLCCIGSNSDPSLLKAVNVQTLEDLFSPFGSLRKLLIFSKKDILKAFIEFESFTSAAKAAKHLNNKEFSSHGKLAVYESNMKTVKIDNKNLEHKIFDEKMNTSTDDSESHKSESDYLEEISKKNPILLFNRNKKKSSFFSQERKISGGKTLFKKGSGLKKTESVSSNEELEYPTKPTSRVVLVSNLEDVFATKFELFNLFSCFGYVKQLIYMNNLKKALIEYRTLEEAEVSYRCMNCVDMGHTTLKVNYSKYKTIDVKRSNRNVNSINYNEIFIVPTDFQREEREYKTIIDELSSSLLVELRDVGDMEVLDIYLEIEPIAKPTKMNFKKEKDDSGKTNIRFNLKYDSISSAIKVLLKTHRKEVGGKRISVRFN